MIVQIYEIQDPREAENCIEAGVDRIGSVILSERDWRSPDLMDTVRVSDGTGVQNSIIPLFQDVDKISSALDYYMPDFIHLCESLTKDQAYPKDLDIYIEAQRKIKERFPEIGIIRSMPIPGEGVEVELPTIEIARNFEPVTDQFLTDTWLGKEPVEGFIGLTGKTCDRKIARELVIRSNLPVILAGGLSPENVYDALMAIQPAGADSCTLTNRLDNRGLPIRFQKDFAKVEKFVKETRRAEDMVTDRKEQLKMEIEELKTLLSDRREALPAHSVQPHQLQAIEDLEDEITAKEKDLERLKQDLSSHSC
jgi:phosphoribosylanthranilate isomerase